MDNQQGPTNEVLLELYKKCALAKINDENARRVIMNGTLPMIYYSPRGQEVIPAAMSVNLRDDDTICTIYRGMHDMVCKGVPVDALWAEYAGKATGTCKGKGGPMHITHPESGCMLTTGIVGSSLPIANGLALSYQLRNLDNVSVAYFGDAASNIGAFHEALNMASIWKLPVVFVCQNNRYGEHTTFAKATSVNKVSDRAASYGMPGIHVDGNDAIAMYNAAKEAIDHARSGKGPVLIEAMTFRFYGHVFGDQDGYMDQAEKKRAMENDPVPKLRDLVISRGIASDAELTEMEAAIDSEIKQAIEAALSAPWPDVDELGKDVVASAV
ncbi:thiamine pyrophosphate-dependent dehydrogenase E1 component subunit alpha [Spongiibacter sp. KMU-166]|uniref:Thiamine pyrophosphate-dependent dehydrogenase E1 component subunit alpha n=1 Tax=Spongiibacter thalassae TaxID=2721624 RepID=A0ABX1GD00_9GAMM|nr:thiamine pyrophosphate-dependent dehydrogenase E1 component subunit alpha [Spongiibacter thalassae]NKI16368.1 thiamine pyrophosphate-dependent dehydrogenase E1 component subunit alpha [Spongiibacter thalassae]